MKTKSAIALLSLALITSVFGADPVACGPDGLRLVGHWPADGTLSDTVGTNHATMHNGASFGTGVHGQSFCVDGTNDFVRISRDEKLRTSGPFTIEFWFRPTLEITAADTQAHIFLSIGSAGSIGTANSAPNTPNGGYIEFSANGLSSRPTSVASNWQAGTWHHLAVTFRPAVTTNPAVYSLFVDGALQGDRNGNVSLLSDSADITLGATSTGLAPFAGCIDELAIYSRELSAAEIRDIYAAITFEGVRPRLSILPIAECFFASWPSSFTNYVPQAAASLGSVVSWSDLTNAVVTIGVRSLFIDSGAAAQRFYQLRRQD